MLSTGSGRLSWEVRVEHQGRLIVANTSGVMHVEDLLRLVEQLIREARQHGMVRVLMDCRHMDLGMSKSDIYACRSLVESRAVRRDMRTAIAIAPDATHMDHYQFYETVAANNGWSVRIFTDVDAARAWLADDGCHTAGGS